MVYKKSSLGLLIICLILGYFYITPKFKKYTERKQNKKIVENCTMLSDYILKECKANKKANLEEKAKNAVELFSTQVQNPVNNKVPAFGLEQGNGVCSAEYEKETKTIVVTGLDTNGSILVRIVINPPTFVRYDRD
jgi:hypothetical protein